MDEPAADAAVEDEGIPLPEEVQPEDAPLEEVQPAEAETEEAQPEVEQAEETQPEDAQLEEAVAEPDATAADGTAEPEPEVAGSEMVEDQVCGWWKLGAEQGTWSSCLQGW